MTEATQQIQIKPYWTDINIKGPGQLAYRLPRMDNNILIYEIQVVDFKRPIWAWDLQFNDVHQDTPKIQYPKEFFRSGHRVEYHRLFRPLPLHASLLWQLTIPQPEFISDNIQHDLQITLLGEEHITSKIII